MTRPPRARRCGARPRAARRRLRREAGAHRRRLGADRPRARLLRQPRPRRDLHGARARLLRRGRARSRARTSPPIPRRRSARSPPGAPTSRSPTSPRSCSPSDQGLPVTAVAALVPQPLTSLISLPKAGIADPADLAGKTVATAGIPYQADYLDAIVERAGRRPRRRLAAGRRAEPAAGGALGQRRRDAWRLSQRRGRRPGASAACTRGSSRSTSSGSRPTTSSSWSPTTDRVADDPEPIRLFIAALERGTRAAVRDPQAATEAILDAGDGLEPKLTRAEVDRDPAAARPAGPASVRLHGLARVGAVRRLLRRPRPDLDPADGRGDVHRRPAARPGTGLATARSAAQAARRSGGPRGDRAVPAGEREASRRARETARRARSTPRPPRPSRGARARRASRPASRRRGRRRAASPARRGR